MPLDEARIDAYTTRLKSAYQRSLQEHLSHPHANELNPNFALGKDWSTICSAYSGIEQTLKLTIAVDAGLTINELLGTSLRRAPPQRRNGPQDHKTHDLGVLFSQLFDHRTEPIEEHYARWQSLYAYVPMLTCQDFLDHVEDRSEERRREARGYQGWRYCLIQDDAPVANSAEAMLAVWGALLFNLRDYRRSPVRSIEDEIADTIRHDLEAGCLKEQQRRIDRGEEPLPALEELQRWAPSRDELLNASAETLSHYEKYLYVPENAGSEPWCAVLTKYVRTLRCQARDRRGALYTFARASMGYHLGAETVRWKPATSRFEHIAWPLSPESLGGLPPEAAVIEARHEPYPRLRYLYHLARTRGYRLKETRTRTDNRPDNNTWHLRLRLYDEREGHERARLSIWENADDREKIALTMHVGEPALDRAIACWLDELPNRLGAPGGSE